MTTFTASDVAAQRSRVKQLEQNHEAAHTEATQWLAQVKSAVEDDGAAGPSADQVAEKFAPADTLAEQLDAEKAVLARMYESRNGADADDQRPGTDAAAFLASMGALPGGTRRIDPAAGWINDERVKAAMESGNVDAVRRLSDVPLLTAEQFASMMSPMAATVDGSPLVPDDQSRVDQLRGLPVRIPVLLDWIRIGTTDSDSVPYTRQTVETSNFGDANPLTAGGASPGESTITYEPDSEEIRDRATELPIPRRNLADSGRMRSIINGRLIGMARRDLENQLIAGDGTGSQMTGIVNWDGVGTYTRVADEPVAITLHKGITLVRTSLLEEPDGVALSAQDWEILATDRGSDGHYVNSAGPLAAMAMTVWQKRATIAHVLAATQAIVGKWDEDELVIREGVSVREFEQHSDFATKQLVMMLAMYRAANIIERAQAFAVLDTTEPV